MTKDEHKLSIINQALTQQNASLLDALAEAFAEVDQLKVKVAALTPKPAEMAAGPAPEKP